MIRAELITSELSVGKPGDLTLCLTNDGSTPCTNIVFTLRLPPQIPSIRGGKVLEVDRLAAGQSSSSVIRVRPLQAGDWKATSSNFSFRDYRGASFRVSDFSTTLRVDAAVEEAEAPLPRIDIALSTPVLAHDEWQTLRGYVTNTGATAIRSGRLSIRGPFTVDPDRLVADLVDLRPGEKEEFAFHVRTGESGREVPVHVTAVFANGAGRRAETKRTYTVQVGRAAKPDRVQILYLSANPDTEQRLGLERELRDIKDALRKGKERDRFKLESEGALRARDLTQALLDFSPRIVHFSGHGADDGRFIAETDSGGQRVLSKAGVAALFAQVSGTVECVIVNACHSEALARALSQHINYVIGMRSWIGDQSAIDFSVVFYQALAAGWEIEEAFEFARAGMLAGESNGRGGDVPVLLRKV
ncbi:CHAT domain-containing protein [Amycolatopsis sp. NPDC098790]|uniref:CHAT domain-containing protein n=1 Tax=Amycolatopsis sp. NPDC098790 TaxID=3363939 RepID=UPI0037F3DC52